MKRLHGDLMLLGIGTSALAMFAAPALFAAPRADIIAGNVVASADVGNAAPTTSWRK